MYYGDDGDNNWSKLDWFFFILIQLVVFIFFVSICFVAHDTYEFIMALMIWFYGTLTLWCVY